MHRKKRARLAGGLLLGIGFVVLLTTLFLHREGENSMAAVTHISEYECFKTSDPPVIDGLLNGPAWAKAPRMELVLADSGTKPALPTYAQAVWDDEYLYIAFHCEDREIWGTLTQKNDPIYTQEVVEVFIDSTNSGTHYRELELSPANVLFDAYILNNGRNVKAIHDYSESGLRHAVHVEGNLNKRDGTDKFWSAELAIPFEHIFLADTIPPVPGEAWRINFYRIDISKDTTEYTAWSPIGEINFHKPDRFGKLIFRDEK